MAVNKPVGDNARKGAVRKRSQLKIKVAGEGPVDEARQDERRIHGDQEKEEVQRRASRTGKVNG
jgi:hypothetical protein